MIMLHPIEWWRRRKKRRAELRDIADEYLQGLCLAMVRGHSMAGRCGPWEDTEEDTQLAWIRVARCVMGAYELRRELRSKIVAADMDAAFRDVPVWLWTYDYPKDIVKQRWLSALKAGYEYIDANPDFNYRAGFNGYHVLHEDPVLWEWHRKFKDRLKRSKS